MRSWSSGDEKIRETRREQQELRETGWHLQCGAQTVETEAGWEGSRAGASARAHRDGGGA